jgi:hypothetical protein
VTRRRGIAKRTNVLVAPVATISTSKLICVVNLRSKENILPAMLTNVKAPVILLFTSYQSIKLRDHANQMK